LRRRACHIAPALTANGYNGIVGTVQSDVRVKAITDSQSVDAPGRRFNRDGIAVARRGVTGHFNGECPGVSAVGIELDARLPRGRAGTEQEHQHQRDARLVSRVRMDVVHQEVARVLAMKISAQPNR
jgi:hypothetical protein